MCSGISASQTWDNPEIAWVLVFVFDSNRPADIAKDISPKRFRFVGVFGARLTEDDWLFSGRSETSRRTITATIARSGYEQMLVNWIYQDPLLKQGQL